jgi:hypothetical protein
MSWEARYPVLRRIEVYCRGCGQWIPYRRLERDQHQSPYTSWIIAFHCPRCYHHIATSHGADPGYGIESSYFEERIMAALESGGDWVRLGPEPREE